MQIFGAKAAIVHGFPLDEESFKKVLNRVSSDIQFTLIPKQSCYILRLDQSNTDVAVLDTRTTSALQTIMTISPIRLNIFKDNQQLFNHDNQNSNQRSSMDVIHLVLDVYGPRKQVKAIGDALSKARFYLQRPYHLDILKDYENPHVFRARSQKSESSRRASHHSLPDLEAPTIDAPRDDRHATVVEQVLQTTIQNQSIQEVEADRRIQTDLLRHQKQALNFIQQRESGTMDDNLSLWKLHGTKDQPYYQHEITGFRTETYPAETRGGILADEMGLGKTLSLVSAIVTSLDEAWAYPNDQETRARVGANWRSRATLVVAPSAGLRIRDSYIVFRCSNF
jgi:SWI/SNF-related matrix-associated actin-dependent regulator of chromatin subfamily A3